MTKDEDDWLSDFLEAAQASTQASQAAAEKEYAAKLKLFTPRFERARPSDSEEELARRLAAGTALAGQQKFDAASDALDEAWTLAGDLLLATAAAAVSPATEDETVTAEPMAESVAPEAEVSSSEEGPEVPAK